MLDKLPQELVECILFCVTDPPTLTSSSLVSRSWTHTCQIRLLQIGVQFDLRRSAADAVKSLYNFLHLRPEFRRHLSDIEILDVVRRIPSECGTYLANILEFSLALRRLSLKTVRWSFLPSRLQMAISASLQLPSLRCLEFRSFVLPDCATLTELLSLSKYLESLQLRSVTWSNFTAGSTKEPGTETTEPKFLQALSLITADMGGILSWLLGNQPTFRLSCLRRLQLSNACDPSSLTELLAITSPTLEHLILEPIYTFHEPMISPHLSKLPRLLHLELAGVYRFLLPLIQNSFQDLVYNHPLKTIRIQIEEANSQEDWQPLDALLNQSALGALSSVMFWMSTKSLKQGYTGTETLLNQFPVLHAKRLCSLALYGRFGSAELRDIKQGGGENLSMNSQLECQ